jgi:hypothetical protein
MRGAIIGCTLLIVFSSSVTAFGQENPRRPKYMLIAEKAEANSSYWPSWGLPNLWPTGLGSRLAYGTRSTWNTLTSGTSRAWYATQYTIAPWSKPAPRPLTGSRGITSSSKSKSKAKEGESTASWWPSFNWFGGEKEEKLKNVGDWQELSSPAEGFE